MIPVQVPQSECAECARLAESDGPLWWCSDVHMRQWCEARAHLPAERAHRDVYEPHHPASRRWDMTGRSERAETRSTVASGPSHQGGTESA